MSRRSEPSRSTGARALLGAVSSSALALFLVVACGSSEPETPDAGTTTAATAPRAVDSGRPDTGPPRPTGPPKRIFTKRFVVNVRTGPDREALRIGYLRAGAVLQATTAEPVSSEGCRGGWFELTTGGFVCNGWDVIAFDGRRLPERRSAQPDAAEPLPYRYARTRRDDTPMYRRLPTDVEAAVYEGYRIPGMRLEHLPDGGVIAVEALPEPEPTPGEAIAAEVIPPTEAQPAVAREGASEAAAGGATTDEAEEEEEAIVTLGELEGERGTVLQRRLVKGFIVSLDRDMRVRARRYWRTLNNGFVPYATQVEVRGSSFHGVELAAAPTAAASAGEGAPIGGGDRAARDAVAPTTTAGAAPTTTAAAAPTTTAAAAPTTTTPATASTASAAPPPTTPATASTTAAASRGGAAVGGEAAPTDAMVLPVGYVLSSKTVAYARGRDGRPRRSRPPGYHHVFRVAGHETHREREYVVAADGALFERRDVTIIEAHEPPSEIGPDDHWIEIDLTNQALVAYEGRRPVYATLVSTGRVRDPDDPLRDMRTPTGVFRITSKHVTHTMDGDHAVDGPYSIEDVPYVMYFQLAYALHSAFWHDGFGRPRSHGCVNLAPIDARWIFQWATPELPERWHGVYPTPERPGTWLWIHGETPEG